MNTPITDRSSSVCVGEGYAMCECTQAETARSLEQIAGELAEAWLWALGNLTEHAYRKLAEGKDPHQAIKLYYRWQAMKDAK